jgi:hypothetical protein
MSSTEDYFAPFDYLQPRPDLEAFTQQRQEQRDSSRAERERQATQAHEQRSRGFFHLPTWASPETDTPIGEDEYGNTRYLAATGQEYILPRMQTQQRGSLIRGAYEAIPPMQDWRLPTREELGSAASAVGGAVQNFLEIPTNPNATFADVLDVAGTAMTGGLSGRMVGIVPENSLGMFVGERAGIRLPELQSARQLESQGYTPQEIWRDTGWVRGLDNHWRTEISDQFFELSPAARARIQEGRSTYEMDFGEIFEHPELIQAYPDTMTSNRGWIAARQGSAESGEHQGVSFADGHFASRINVEGPSIEDIERILLHELQHSVQRIEGFSSGFNPTSAQIVIDRTIGRFSPDIREYALRRLGYQSAANRFYALHEYIQSPNEFFQQNLRSSDPYISRIVDQHRLGRQDRIQQAYRTEAESMSAFRESMQDFESNFPRSAREVDRMSDFILTPDPYRLYRRNAGEVEANVTTDRRYMSEAERRATFPELEPEHTWTRDGLNRSLGHMLRTFRNDGLLLDAQ